jgi:predicted esterase
MRTSLAQLFAVARCCRLYAWRSWLVALLFTLGCKSSATPWRPLLETEATPPVLAGQGNSDAKARASARDSGPVRMEALADFTPEVFVLRGRGIGPGKLVFLHGMCGHGLGYAQSFQHAASRQGTLIAPQADVVCGGGPWAKWSQDVKALDARITAAFRKLGFEEPIDDILVLGMSQGATRAAALARQFPERYTRLVSMGAPTKVDPAGLAHLQGAALMVGERERKDLMRASETSLKLKGVPARSFVIPDADHAGMGSTPERTMSDVLDWLVSVQK